MGLFDCRGCKAKDSEIVHLMAQLEKLSAMVEKANARVAELAEPGIALRMAGADRMASVGRPPAPRAARPMVQGFPGYGPEPKAGPHVQLDEDGS